MRTLIKGGTVVTAAEMTLADVLIDGERIQAVGAELGEADRVIDATGKYVMPGGIDAHTHLDMPFGGTTRADDFETGTLAAAYGGHHDDRRLRRSRRKGESLRQGLDAWHAKAEGKAASTTAST